MKELFKKWIEKQKKEDGSPYSTNTINSYISALKLSPSKLEIEPEYKKSIFLYVNSDEYQEAKDKILSASNFESVNQAAGNKAFSCGMILYEKFLNDNQHKKIWKLSHGLDDFSEEDIDDYLKKSIVCVHKDTGSKARSSLPQGVSFTDKVSPGDIFYLCRGNQRIILIGEFSSDGVEIDEDGWAYRKYKKLYSSIKSGRYEGESKWWTPNNNSTFIEIKKNEYSDFEKLILQPYFGIKLQQLLSGDSTMQYITKYKELLLETHNLILHGAPGTGKTHLAKEIAEAMNAEVAFCQFHPSYDYTDFVEGLRPISSDDRGQIGFKRTDGVFKEFCANAVKNVIESKKSIEEIKLEKSVEEKIKSFLLDSVENEKEYELVGKKTRFIIKNIDEKKIYIEAANKVSKDVDVKISDLIAVMSANKDFSQANEIAKFLNHPNYGFQSDSYVFALYKELKANNNSQELEFDNVKIEKKNFVFIIDEINRGELSKIFGELFFSIDPGYRGLDENGKPKGLVTTQYQNLVEDTDPFKKGFFVPENVYIIGTMNDIDRSVESMDFAMRRRFIFKEVTAEESAENMNLPDEAKETMKRINDLISKTEGLGTAYHIGGAYFLNVTDFDKLWNLKLSSLVKEYLRGLDDDDLKYKEIETAYFNWNQDDSE